MAFEHQLTTDKYIAVPSLLEHDGAMFVGGGTYWNSDRTLFGNQIFSTTDGVNFSGPTVPSQDMIATRGITLSDGTNAFLYLKGHGDVVTGIGIACSTEPYADSASLNFCYTGPPTGNSGYGPWTIYSGTWGVGVVEDGYVYQAFAKNNGSGNYTTKDMVPVVFRIKESDLLSGVPHTLEQVAEIPHFTVNGHEMCGTEPSIERMSDGRFIMTMRCHEFMTFFNAVCIAYSVSDDLVNWSTPIWIADGVQQMCTVSPSGDVYVVANRRSVNYLGASTGIGMDGYCRVYRSSDCSATWHEVEELATQTFLFGFPNMLVYDSKLFLVSTPTIDDYWNIATGTYINSMYVQSRSILSGFEHRPPRYVYDDRFTAVWFPYSGSDFISYRVYVRPSATDIASWKPSGTLHLYAEITDQEAFSQVVSGLTKQTEYDVVVAVLTTTGLIYEPRQLPVMRGVPTPALHIGGARHVNTVDTNEMALYMDGDTLVGTPAFSVIDGRAILSMLTNENRRSGTELELFPNGRVEVPKDMAPRHGFGCAVQNGTHLWAWTGHYCMYADRVEWPAVGRGQGADDRYFIWSAVTRSADGGRSWTEREYMADLGIGEGFKLMAGAGEPLALSDGSEIVPLYVSPIASPMANRTDSLALYRTTDGGRTFALHGFVCEYPPPDGYWAYGEPCIEKIGGAYPNEHLVCAFRPNTGASVGFAQSLQSGLAGTWTTVVKSTQLGSDLGTAQALQMSLPRIKYIDGYLYVQIGNRKFLGTSGNQYTDYDSVNNAAYLFRKQVAYTGSLIPSIDTGWSNGLKLGGSSAATQNFDANGYGAMHAFGDGVLHCAYLSCVGRSKELGNGGLSFPHIAYKKVDLATFTEIPHTKKLMTSQELLADRDGRRIDLAFAGTPPFTIERTVL
jgi:hypothetical protein